MDLMLWEVGIPGKVGTDWEGGVYEVLMQFPEGECHFLFHLRSSSAMDMDVQRMVLVLAWKQC